MAKKKAGGDAPPKMSPAAKKKLDAEYLARAEAAIVGLGRHVHQEVIRRGDLGEIRAWNVGTDPNTVGPPGWPMEYNHTGAGLAIGRVIVMDLRIGEALLKKLNAAERNATTYTARVTDQGVSLIDPDGKANLDPGAEAGFLLGVHARDDKRDAKRKGAKKR